MYTYSYRHIQQGNSIDGENCINKTILEAEFLFGNETAPMNIEMVHARCGRCSSDILPCSMTQYLHNPENLNPVTSFSSKVKEYHGKKTQVQITPLKSQLGFKFAQTGEGHFPLEKMVDLEALNRFVLTGEYTLKDL
ncbi:hypothetical protein HOD75_00510 [archaeon]|jgi:hypothetical protein|nr:hypothetical protein [archaeon]MBT4241357.1 hypothetical protein [archaeon]MBT4418178.1 hypothetical protein [archaeon]